jgi:hypothetical protein
VPRYAFAPRDAPANAACTTVMTCDAVMPTDATVVAELLPVRNTSCALQHATTHSTRVAIKVTATAASVNNSTARHVTNRERTHTLSLNLSHVRTHAPAGDD